MQPTNLTSRGLDRLLQLNPQQKNVLAALLKGRSIKEIAYALKLSTKTIGYHKRQIQIAFGVNTDLEMVRYAITHGIDYFLQKLELSNVPASAYHFTAFFRDGETITQDVPNENWEYKPIDYPHPVTGFGLFNDDDVWMVNLISGTFQLNGRDFKIYHDRDLPEGGLYTPTCRAIEKDGRRIYQLGWHYRVGNYVSRQLLEFH